MRSLLVVLASIGLFIGCGGPAKDELGPYVEQIGKLSKYEQPLADCAGYLHDSESVEKAYDLATIFANVKTDFSAIAKPENKTLGAIHNTFMRAIDQSIKKLKDPDSPTFIPNAQKWIKVLQEANFKRYSNLKKLWEEDRSEPFPLSPPVQ